DEQVRIAEHDLAVLERPRLRFVRVHYEIRRLRTASVYEARFAARRKARSAAPAQVRGDQLVEDGVRLHAACRLERCVAADRAILVELRQIAVVGVLEEQATS